MTVPDKLGYTKGERLAEILCGAFAACIAAAMVVMMALGATDGGNIILLVVLLIINGVFSLCSVYPQHTNIFSKPERISEKGFRTTRRAFLIAQAVFTAALFVLSLPIIPIT